MVPTFLLQDAHLWAINWLDCTQGWEVSSCLSYRERGPWRMESLWLSPEMHSARSHATAAFYTPASVAGA